MKDLFKGSFTILLFKLFGAGLILIINLIISNYFGVKQLGEYNLIFSLLQMLSIISILGMDVFVIKTIPRLDQNTAKEGGLITKIFSTLILTSLVIAITFYVSTPFIESLIFRNSGEVRKYLKLLPFLIFPVSFNTLVPEILRAFNNLYMFSFLKNVAQSFSILLFMIILYFTGIQDSITALYLGYILSFIFTIAVIFLFFKNRNISLISYDKYHESIIKHSSPMLLGTSIIFVISNIDSFMISYFKGEYSVGIYSACLKIGLIITFILTSVTSYIVPSIAKSYHEKNYSNVKSLYNKATLLIIFLTIPIVLIIFIFGEEILKLFNQELTSYSNVLYTVLLMNLSNVFFGPIIYILSIMEKQNYVNKVLFISLVINILINWILIPKFGVIGAAIATIISTLFWKITLYLKLKRSLNSL
jgi:O-antigen/teichoic acid export membrane protein